MVAPHHSHFTHTTLTNLGKTYHTCIASQFLSVFLFLFLVYRSGAFGWIDAAQVSKKKESLAHSSSIVADRVVVRGGHCCYRVLSLLCFTYRSVFLYLLLVWSTFNRALFSLHDHDQSIHALLVIVIHRPVKIGRNGRGLV